jgi:hypothetical protein
MNKTVDIRHVEFVLAVEKHNPIILNPEFLKAKGIVPIDWELAQPPTYIDGTALIAFQNGIYIAHQGNIVAFFEDARAKNLDKLEVPQIAHRYIEMLPQENYQAVGINLEGHTTFDTQDRARNYLLETLLNSARSHSCDRDIVQAVVNFIYKLDRGRLTLTVRNTALNLSEEESIAVILFSANFNRNLAEVIEEERLHVLFQILENWQTDIETYKAFVNNRFLKQEAE